MTPMKTATIMAGVVRHLHPHAHVESWVQLQYCLIGGRRYLPTRARLRGGALLLLLILQPVTAGARSPSAHPRHMAIRRRESTHFQVV